MAAIDVSATRQTLDEYLRETALERVIPLIGETPEGDQRFSSSAERISKICAEMLTGFWLLVPRLGESRAREARDTIEREITEGHPFFVNEYGRALAILQGQGKEAVVAKQVADPILHARADAQRILDILDTRDIGPLLGRALSQDLP